jgi:hypothetical protein
MVLDLDPKKGKLDADQRAREIGKMLVYTISKAKRGQIIDLPSERI